MRLLHSVRNDNPFNVYLFKPFTIIGQFFDENLPRARKERQIAPQALYRDDAGQASAGYPLPINSLLAIRKAQRGRDKKASEEMIHNFRIFGILPPF
jgi:hypothetical protein